MEADAGGLDQSGEKPSSHRGLASPVDAACSKSSLRTALESGTPMVVVGRHFSRKPLKESHGSDTGCCVGRRARITGFSPSRAQGVSILS